MIGHLRGRLISKKGDRVIVDVQGVGYEVIIPFSTFNNLSREGTEIELKIYTHVREDHIQLYGFVTEIQKELFQLLLTVSGIGPKTALAIISEISPNDLSQIILTKNVKQLTAIPGIGKKTAERLVLELREKIQKLSTTFYVTNTASLEENIYSDLTSALSNLGYKPLQIEMALDQLKEGEDKKGSFENLLKQSLQILRS